MDTLLSTWGGFFVLVVVVLTFDLGLIKRNATQMGIRESLRLSAMYVAVSLCFGFFIFYDVDPKQGRDFFTAYIVEKSLSLDNIFAFSLIFSFFHIPGQYQRRVLFWGILGAVVLRGLMIAAGIELVRLFHAALYLFGGFLVITGIRMLLVREDEEKGPQDNKMLRLLMRYIPVTASLHEDRFLAYEVNEAGKMLRKATPLLLALICIELADIVFAVDSVPAVFAITTDPFVAYTSNIFAILGLRALYFALAAMLHRFAYLKYALSLVLIFIGGKIFLPYPISSALSLAITLGFLAAGVAVSLHKTRKQ